MRESIWIKGVVIGIVVAFLGASTVIGMNTCVPISSLSGGVPHEVPAVIKHIGRQPGLMGNVRVSLGFGNDSNPRMTTNTAGDIIIVYEQEEDITYTTIPVVYSANGGDTWTQQFVFDSYLNYDGSGMFSDPDIIYNPAHDVLWCNAIDPLTDVYSDRKYFIPGDIAHATEALVYSCDWSGREIACTHTNDYYLTITTDDHPIYGAIDEMHWHCYPDFLFPPGLGGFYYDSQSMIRIAPVMEVEADYNTNRWFFVAESGAIEGGTQIVIKSGTTNKTLIDSGEQLNHMDKYGDPEVAPGEFLGLGTDPDVSGSGNMVAVVFVREGNILCSVSSCVATYEPEFHWHTYTVDNKGGASAPAVYIQGNDLYVAYVRDGNLYYRMSQDLGATWGEPLQKNDVNGTVVAEKGSVDVCKFGIAFVDRRNGNYDVYFAEAKKPAPELTIKVIMGGLGISAVIANTGDLAATDIAWSITADGFIIFGDDKSGILQVLNPGDEITIKTGLMFGFGIITVTVSVDTLTVSKEFRLLFIFFKEM